MLTRDPKALLRRLLQEPRESEWLEFKMSNADPDVIGKSVSACANAAILAGRDRAFLVYGIDDRTREPKGTSISLQTMKKGNQSLELWLAQAIEPPPVLELIDFEFEGVAISILVLEPTYDRPARFQGAEYIRIGGNTTSLKNHPARERALWLATGRRKYESTIATTHVRAEEALKLLDFAAYYELIGEPDQNESETLRRFLIEGYIVEDHEGGFDITNLGAILFANDVRSFPSIANKSVRVVRYAGPDKRKSISEQEGRRGYASGFAGLLRYVKDKLPTEEKFQDGVRRPATFLPEVAIREVIANALIHQDFTVAGIGPMVEIYSDRMEVTNPGVSLVEIDRLIAERRSRNENLAKSMRTLGLCEERGSGLNKVIHAIEEQKLPPPEFHSSSQTMRVVLFGPRDFRALSKQEKLRACYQHCVIRWLAKNNMSNTSLRERFSLSSDDYQAVSTIISECVRLERIAPADPDQGKRHARYVPFWARDWR